RRVRDEGGHARSHRAGDHARRSARSGAATTVARDRRTVPGPPHARVGGSTFARASRKIHDMSLRDRGAITGVGETRYSRNSGRSVVALQMEASLAAIADAGLTPKDIDGIIAYAASGVVAEDFVTNFGIPDLRFSATTPMGGASAVAAVQCALAVVATGVCRHVLIPLGRNGASGSRIGARVREMPQFRVVGEFEMPVGA